MLLSTPPQAFSFAECRERRFLSLTCVAYCWYVGIPQDEEEVSGWT
jgi:hypothetical protein